MPSENRPEQGLHATATRENRGRRRRAEGSDERRHVELADHPQHQRPVGHGTDLLHRNRHETSLLPVFREGVSSRISPSPPRLEPCRSKKSLHLATTP